MTARPGTVDPSPLQKKVAMYAVTDPATGIVHETFTTLADADVAPVLSRAHTA